MFMFGLRDSIIGHKFMRMISVALALLFLGSAIANLPDNVSKLSLDACQGLQPYGSPGDFDFYVLQQIWPAEFCNNLKRAGHIPPMCQSPPTIFRTNFTLHGLWATFATPRDRHEWPQCCDSPFGPDLNTTVVAQLLPELLVYWPDLETPIIPYNQSYLWAHEYCRHGTCSGLDPISFMQTAMLTSQRFGTPPFIQQQAGGEPVPLEDLYRDAYDAPVCDPKSVTLCPVFIGCDSSSGALSAVTSCWSHNNNNNNNNNNNGIGTQSQRTDDATCDLIPIQIPCPANLVANPASACPTKILIPEFPSGSP
jgi:ribonuclease I